MRLMQISPQTESVGARAAFVRFHELDALRAAAMLLGIVLHAAVFLVPGMWDTEYPDEASDFYAILFFAIHGFRMPVFFLLSGFFTALLWRRKGIRELGIHRLKRVGLPLAVGAMTVIPVTIWAFVPDDFELAWWPFIWLTTFSHLWFLWLLLWIAGAFMLAVNLGLKFDHPWAWWLALPLTLVPQLLMVEPIFGPDTSETLIPNPVVLAYYALFFAFGAFFYQRGIEMRGWWVVAILPALTVIFWPALSLMYDVKTEWAFVASAPLQVAYAWLMCFGLIGLFRLIAAKERYWVRYMSDASYWMYLWHLPLILVACRIVKVWPVSVHAKFALVCLATTAILLVTYQLGVRYTPIGTMLNGRRVRVSG